MRHGVALLVLVAAVTAGCSDEPEPYYPPAATADADTAYDASAEPSAAALSLVPDRASRLEVVDYDQIRLTLGYGELDGSAPADERAAFWRDARRTGLAGGILRSVDDRLRGRFSLGQDDVAWEARYRGEATTGWVLVFHDDVPVPRIRRAVGAGVGPLAGAVVDGPRRIVSSAELPAADASWAAVPELHALVGREANATYVDRGCVPLDDIYGDGIVDRLDGQAERDVASLRALEGYSVALGSELVTVLLGPEREDAFTRLRLARHLPVLDPEFGTVFGGGVASPADGELGYRMPAPRRTVEWIDARRLPFAACDT